MNKYPNGVVYKCSILAALSKKTINDDVRYVYGQKAADGIALSTLYLSMEAYNLMEL